MSDILLKKRFFGTGALAPAIYEAEAQ